MLRRNTVQKELVLGAVQSMKRHVTAEEVLDYIKVDYPNIGRGTVYRNLAILSEEGLIRRVLVAGGADRFDFTIEDHYHVECMKCGGILDVDMDVIPDIKSKIKNTHGVEFISYDILFKGICKNCQAGI